MKRALLTIATLVLIVGGSALSRAEEVPLKVFVLGGTSNMRGRVAAVDNLPDDRREPLKNVLVYSDGDWVPLEAGKNLVGNEAAFGRAMAKHLDEPIGIYWVTVASAGDRSPAARINSVVERARDSGRPIVVAGILLDVSFRDGLQEEKAAAYKENLIRWIETTRKELGNADLPIVMNRAIPPVARTPYLEQIRKDQDSLELPQFRVFHCDDVPRSGDNVHFNTEGRLEMGKRFAKEMIPLMKAKKEPQDK